MRKHEKRYSITIMYNDDHYHFESTDDLSSALRTMATFCKDPKFSYGYIMDNITGRYLTRIIPEEYNNNVL